MSVICFNSGGKEVALSFSTKATLSCCRKANLVCDVNFSESGKFSLCVGCEKGQRIVYGCEERTKFCIYDSRAVVDRMQSRIFMLSNHCFLDPSFFFLLLIYPIFVTGPFHYRDISVSF